MDPAPLYRTDSLHIEAYDSVYRPAPAARDLGAGRPLLEIAGFDVTAEYGSFERSPPTYGAEQIWVVTPTRPD